MPLSELAAMMTTGDVARYLGVSNQRVHQITQAGKLKHLSTPLGNLYRRKDVERYAKAREQRK